MSTSRSDRARAAVRAAIGSDARLWAQRDTFAPSQVAMRCGSDIRIVHDELVRRGWRSEKRRQYRSAITGAPCRKCGVTFTIEPDQQDRTCPDCREAEATDPAVLLCRQEYARVMARRAKERARISAECQRMVEQTGDPHRRRTKGRAA